MQKVQLLLCRLHKTYSVTFLCSGFHLIFNFTHYAQMLAAIMGPDAPARYEENSSL